MVEAKQSKARAWRRALPIVFATVAICFVATTAYSEFALRKIDSAALQIAENAAPSIEHLAKAHAALRKLQDLVTRRADRQEIARAHELIESEIHGYLELPVQPGEREVWEDVRRQLTRSEDLIDRLIQDVENQRSADLPQAIAGAKTATDLAKRALERSIDFNARVAHDAAIRIRLDHAEAMRNAFFFDGVSVLLTALLGWLLWRAMREHTRLVESHADLLSQRAKDLEEFAGRVAHDILSPLGSVSLAISLAAKAKDEDTRADRLTRATSNLQRVKRIVDGLLDFARAGAGSERGASCDAREVLLDMASELGPAAENAGITLRVEPLPDLKVACSSGVLTSLIANLGRNAIKYMGDSTNRIITIRTLDRDGSARFEVDDTGPGLAPGLEEHIFEPYVRGKGTGQPGIGIGLATVKRMVEAHGGRVAVHSTPGEGCRFWFELPKSKTDPVRLEVPLQTPSIHTVATRST